MQGTQDTPGAGPRRGGFSRVGSATVERRDHQVRDPAAEFRGVFEATSLGQGSYAGGGTNWSTHQTCEVDSQVRLAVPAGEFDTYKIVCQDRWSDEIWYIAPESEELVHFQRYHREADRFTKWEKAKE